MIPPKVIFDATDEALSDTIGEVFDIPEVNLDGQLVEMISGDTSYQKNVYEVGNNNSSAYANDDGLDAALIDLLPF